MDASALASAVRKAQAFAPMKGPMLGFARGHGYKHWLEQIRSRGRSPSARSSEETQIISAYAHIVIAAECLMEVIVELGAPDSITFSGLGPFFASGAT